MRSRTVLRAASIVVLSATSGAFAAPAFAQGAPPAPPAPSTVPTPAGASAAAPTASAASGRRLRVSDCIELALRGNVDVQTSADDIAIGEAQAANTRGYFGPKIKVDAYAHEWNSPYNIPFGATAFPVRDQFEWNVTASATQPITGLFAIFDAYKVRALGVDIASIRHEVTKRETAYRVVESYYRLVQAQKLVEVATASVEQLQAQLKQSNSFHNNGVVSQDDVLRAQLALANAQQRLIQVRARVSLEQSRLAVLVGMPADAIIDVQPLAAEPAVLKDAATIEQAEKVAETQRIELSEVDKRIEQADREVKVAKLRLAPQVSAVGAYIHNEGSLFSQTNSAYVGAVASWDVWDWGTTISGISEAKARLHQAGLARTKISDQIRIEVRRAFLELTAASEAMTVAQASVASAEENFRLVKKRYDASAATSFDVVDAEALLTTSRGQMQTALYDEVIARAALRRAIGTPADKLARE